MVYSISDIKHLEAMKSLDERQAPEVNVKTLLGTNASQPASFEQNILKLCCELRTKGFERHAASLETKFLALKTAKVHLYRAHDEDGEDLVHAAHPDGDVNMGDGELGDVETTVSKHKKIVDVVNKQPTGKLAAYVAQCKMVLGQAELLGFQDEGTPVNPALQKKFSEFISNFLSDIDRVIAPLNDQKYQEAKLPNGKQVKDYNLPGIKDTLKSLSTIDWWDSDTGVQKIFATTDRVIKEIYDLIDQIDKAIDGGSASFDNRQFPDAAWATLNPHREEFLSLYAFFNKDQGAANWHGQFVSTEAVRMAVAELSNKLTSLSTRIDRHILQEPSVQNLKGFIDWFGRVKTIAYKYVIELSGMNAAAEKFIDDMSKLHRGSQALIDAAKLRGFLKQENASILSVEGVNNQTSDANAFLISLNVAYKQLLDACRTSIQAAKFDETVKVEVLRHFGE